MWEYVSSMSDDGMNVIKQNKVKINATVSKKTKTKAEEYAVSDDYGSFSNFVETAMIYYMGALEKEQEIKLKEAEEQLKKNQNEEKDIVTVILKLISNHPELLDEYNELRRKPLTEGVSYNRVKFE